MGKTFAAIGRWFRRKDAETAQAIDDQDPVGNAKLVIEDSERQIKDFTSKIASFMATQTQLEQKLADAQGEVKKYQGLAVKAAKAGNEDHARQFLAEKAKAAQEVTSYKTQVDKNAGAIATLRKQLQKARDKVSQAKSDLTQLDAQLQGAKVRKELAEASSDFAGDGPLGQLDDLRKRVAQEEAEAEAHEELAGEAGGIADLEAEYGSAGDAAVDDELAKLMAKHGKQD